MQIAYVVEEDCTNSPNTSPALPKLSRNSSFYLSPARPDANLRSSNTFPSFSTSFPTAPPPVPSSSRRRFHSPSSPPPDTLLTRLTTAQRSFIPLQHAPQLKDTTPTVQFKDFDPAPPPPPSDRTRSHPSHSTLLSFPASFVPSSWPSPLSSLFSSHP